MPTDLFVLYLTPAIMMSDFNLYSKEVSLTPKYKGAGNGKNFLPEHHWNKQNGKNYAMGVFVYSTAMSH